jgi:NADH/F420H2 dehydrogenase subunit C
MLLKKYSNYLLNILPVYNISIVNENITLCLNSNKDLKNSLFFLKKHSNSRYQVLSDIVGIDYLNKKKRFTIKYNLLSIDFNSRIFIQISRFEKQPVESIIKIYKNSNWFEREIWDMFGIFFFKHPDLKRILTDYGFDGFPLRKDFPLSGYLEIQYNENKKNVIYKPLNLSRKFYNLSFENTWNKNNI